jgi:hypothetical protein
MNKAETRDERKYHCVSPFGRDRSTRQKKGKFGENVPGAFNYLGLRVISDQL